MSRKKLLEKIYDCIKEEYGDCDSVTILVNCQGITVTTTERPFTIGRSMMKINGEWIERRKS